MNKANSLQDTKHFRTSKGKKTKYLGPKKQSNFKEHLKNYSCPICDKQFNKKLELSLHKTLKHEGKSVLSLLIEEEEKDNESDSNSEFDEDSLEKEEAFYELNNPEIKLKAEFHEETVQKQEPTYELNPNSDINGTSTEKNYPSNDPNLNPPVKKKYYYPYRPYKRRIYFPMTCSYRVAKKNGYPIIANPYVKGVNSFVASCHPVVDSRGGRSYKIVVGTSFNHYSESGGTLLTKNGGARAPRPLLFQHLWIGMIIIFSTKLQTN